MGYILQGRINNSRYHLVYSRLTATVSLGLQSSPKPITGQPYSTTQIIHSDYPLRSQLGSEIAAFHPYRFAPTTGSLKPSEKEHNSVIVSFV